MSDYIPIDGKGAGDYIRDILIIERHWDRVLTAANTNLLDYDNRAVFKCSILALEAYLDPILEKSKDYEKTKESFHNVKKGTPQEEIIKTMNMFKALRKALNDSPLGIPEIIEYDD